MLERHASDPVVVDATLSGLRGSEPVVLEKLLQSGDQTPQRETAITMLAATIVRGGQDAAIQNVLASIGEAGRGEWQRSAVLRGAEGAVLNAPMPGTGARRGAPPIANAPCPTCPGGRAGPGGRLCVPARHRANSRRTRRAAHRAPEPGTRRVLSGCGGGWRSRCARRQRPGADRMARQAGRGRAGPCTHSRTNSSDLTLAGRSTAMSVRHVINPTDAGRNDSHRASSNPRLRSRRLRSRRESSSMAKKVRSA